MPAYLCRWQNGDFSVVFAVSKEDAIEQLDEWANADGMQLWRMDPCMINFRLDDDGEIEVDQFGDKTIDLIMRKCYPELEDMLEFDASLRRI